MSVLSQSFFPFVSSHFMAFSLFTAWHEIAPCFMIIIKFLLYIFISYLSFLLSYFCFLRFLQSRVSA